MKPSPGLSGDIHSSTEHLAIKNTLVRRCLTRIALRTLAKFYKREGVCIPISKHKIVKTGHGVDITEAATLKYLAEKTIVPVPKVYCSFIHKKKGYIVMERIQGQVLPKVWRRMSQDSRDSIFAQLKTIIRDLRELSPPGTAVESCVGGSLYDFRVTPHGRFGPFPTIQSFHLALREGLVPAHLTDREKDEDWHDLHDMMDRQDGPWPLPKFTHGDLHPFNIIVRHGNVAGIIDWEYSGWYPHYWEYTSAWFGNATRTDWQESLHKFLDLPQPEDLKMEATRNKWWST